VVRLGLLLPLVLAYCVPMVLPAAFLTAIIMAFGRLSADNELTAIRAAGIPLFSVIHPVLTAGIILSLVAAYFQFETVPRVRGTIKALRYEALKQVLLDKVALSWKRQFSFPPAFIQYNDFRDGKMLGVVVVEVRGQRPRTIMTAASSSVRPDPEHSEDVVFEMNDCVITRFDIQEANQPQTIASERALYSVRVAPSADEVLTHSNYLTLGPLLRELQRVRGRLSGQARLDEPNVARQKAMGKRNSLDAQIGKLDQVLAATEGKLQRSGIQEVRRQQQALDGHKKLIDEGQQRLQELQKQQADCLKQINDMQAAGRDLERLVELQRQHSSLLAQVDAKKKEVEGLNAQVAAAQKVRDKANALSAQLQAQVDELKQRREVLTGQREELSKTIRLAADQTDLKEIKILLHKRLAQALSVFVFALIGIPLGILPSRRSIMIAFGMSFAIVLLVFYPLLILGQIMAEAGTVPIGPAIWTGDALTFVIGAALMTYVLRR
jgi:lipopolysaccharide export LptBFGC system permease protein LptF